MVEQYYRLVRTLLTVFSNCENGFFACFFQDENPIYRFYQSLKRLSFFLVLFGIKKTLVTVFEDHLSALSFCDTPEKKVQKKRWEKRLEKMSAPFRFQDHICP